MKYFLFNSNIYFKDEVDVKKIEKGPQLKSEFEDIDEACICVVDVDVELASAPETEVEKKDSMLARKFSKLHPQNEYILQDERLDDNIFQVIGIKTEKVREIYSLIPGHKVRVFTPYAVAIRHFMLNKNIELSKGVVFIDDWGDEKLITVFSGLKFGVTRTLLASDTENLLPEIKRSQIGFSKKIEIFENWKSDNLSVLTNSQSLANYLSKIDQGLSIRCLNVQFPAFEGLEIIKNSSDVVRFLLPEEIKSKKRREQIKEKAISVILSLLILGIGLGFLLFTQIKLNMLRVDDGGLLKQNKVLADKLAQIDMAIYRDDLKQRHFLNYATPYLEILNILPQSYETYSFRYYQTDHWKLEAYIFSKDGESFDDIPQVGILKNAVINDYFIKDKPGKRIQVEL